MSSMNFALLYDISINYYCHFSNWGTENDPECNYHNGNSEPRGFGNLTFQPFFLNNETAKLSIII